MSNKFNDICLKYKDILTNYQYIDNLLDIPLKSHVIYISKKTQLKKGGFLKDIDEEGIIHLFVGNRKWSIYSDKNYIFYKLSKNEVFKRTLQKLVDNDFGMKK